MAHLDGVVSGESKTSKGITDRWFVGYKKLAKRLREKPVKATVDKQVAFRWVLLFVALGFSSILLLLMVRVMRSLSSGRC